MTKEIVKEYVEKYCKNPRNFWQAESDNSRRYVCCVFWLYLCHRQPLQGFQWSFKNLVTDIKDWDRFIKIGSVVRTAPLLTLIDALSLPSDSRTSPLSPPQTNQDPVHVNNFALLVIGVKNVDSTGIESALWL